MELHKSQKSLTKIKIERNNQKDLRACTLWGKVFTLKAKLREFPLPSQDSDMDCGGKPVPDLQKERKG